MARRAAVVAAIVAGLFAGFAAPAAAHAILLRSDPLPQTTVPRPPSSVRLFFSESVEAAFGAIRVFDVDGRRVDSGRVRRAGGNREVTVPLTNVRDGTYTVTWRVVSADGHPVHGGFGFYVGTPSTISPASVKAERSAGRVVSWSFGVVRFAWFAALVFLVGAVVVRRWVWTPAISDAGGGDDTSRFRRRFTRLLPLTWLVLAVSGLLGIVFEAATVSGLSLASSLAPSVWTEILPTAFGRTWAVQVALTALLLGPVAVLGRRRPLAPRLADVWIAIGAVVVAGIAVASSVAGHARTLAHPALAVPSLAVHLLAVSTWVGGLAALVVVGLPAWRALPEPRRPEVVDAVLRRFSRVAVVAAAAVVATGVLNSVFDLASVSDLWRTTYGRVVVAKGALVAIALALAARHRFVFPDRLRRGTPGAVRQFNVSAVTELVAVIGALALAAGLVALIPGRSLALAARGPVNQEHRAGQYTVQFFLDPSSVGANQVHLTFVDSNGLAAGDVATADASIGPANSAPIPVDLRLISPGHFVADAALPRPGRYTLDVRTPGASTTFSFALAKKARA